MKGKQGAAKGWHRVFHKGATMHWVIACLLVFLVPVSAQGTDWAFFTLTNGAIGDKPEIQLPPVSWFAAYANKEVMNVRMDVRVYTDKNIRLDEQTKGRCLLSVGGKNIGNMRDHIIYGINGPEIWLPHLHMGEEVEVFIIWQSQAPKLRFTTTVIDNFRKKDSSGWEAGKGRGHALRDRPKPEHLADYQALSLDEVCETFTADAAQAFEDNLPYLKIRY